VESQTCGNRPQFYNPTNPPPKFYWSPDISVVLVKVDGFFESMQVGASGRIIEGNEKWNNPFTCSAVRFKDFETVLFTEDEYADPAPLHHVYWQVDDLDSPFNGGVLIEPDFGVFVFSARVKIKPNIVIPDPRYFNYLGTHEIGHTFALDDCLSTKNPPCVAEDLTIMGGHKNTVFDTQGPTPCDFAKVRELYCPSPSPTPSPTPTPDNPDDCQSANSFWNFQSGGCFPEPQTCDQRCAPYYSPDGAACEAAVDYCGFQWGCGFGFTDGGSGCCCVPTPILIDVAGNGFSLTNAYDGVNFDMGGDGHKEPIAWTTLGTDDAWLVLDRNNNGTIDSAKEMFGNFTDQPNVTTERHGFIALAEFDSLENGGNSDGKIKETDSVFGLLRLWQDVNKNGISEPSELHTLKQLGLKTIELDYKESRRTDEHGNQFKYRAKIRDNNDAQLGRWAWDVILKVNPLPRP
jgi:hypothetical protein